MIEIRHGEDYEMADLAGKSVAEVREQYKQQLGIPDKAQASLGGKGIRRKHESETWLGDDDRLTFAQKSRKGLFFGVAVLLALVVSSSVFAYTATTISAGLTLTGGQSDYAAVTVAGTLATWDVFGSYKGAVTAGDLFLITPHADFTGDMVCILTLTNAHELVDAYRMLVLEIEIYDTDTTPEKVGTTEYLTLSKGECSIEFSQIIEVGNTYTVEITDGFYITHRGGWTATNENPSILCDVLQKGV